VIWRVFQFQVPFHLPSLVDIPQIAPHDDHHLLGSASSSNHAALLQPKSHRTVQQTNLQGPHLVWRRNFDEPKATFYLD
jgi:hypothetical protein